MSRIKLSIAFIFSSSLLVACGGGGGSPDSSTGSTITASESTPVQQAPASSCAGDTLENAPVTMSLEELPYCDPAPLIEMVAMDPAAYDNMLMNDWAYVEDKLHKYIPPNVTLYPAPRAFYGVMASCLEQHGTIACREYMNSLIGVNNNKTPQ
jgi:hypothetical protein